MFLKNFLYFFIFNLLIFTIEIPLNLNSSVIENLTEFEKKIVVCDKIAQIRTKKEGGKFRDKIIELFGEVIYSNKRKIYDRLISNCLKKINSTFTENLLEKLINDKKIIVKQSPIEEMLELKKIYETKAINFNKIKRNITKILNKLYHPEKYKKNDKKIENINDVNEIYFFNFVLYYSNFDLIILFIVFILIIIIFIFFVGKNFNKKIKKKSQ